jgi:hypothetical protein
MTLQGFMDKYRDPDDRVLYDEYTLCDKDKLVNNFKKAKEAKENAPPTRVNNISVSKRVYAKVENITASVCSYHFLNVFLTHHVLSLVPGTQSTIWD